MHAVILAGGRGERFWPLSRRDRPKQLLPLAGARSLLHATLDRLEGWISHDDLWVVAGSPLIPELRRHLGARVRADRYIEEPRARNTAAAIGAASAVIEARDSDALTLVLPSDHWIPDPERFRADVERTATAARKTGGLHLFGIPITRPDCGYGYVERGEDLNGHPEVARVARFHEKPDLERAIAYATRPEMLWNSGIFVWSVGAILNALDRLIAPARDQLAGLRAVLAREGGLGGESLQALGAYLDASPAESIDTAVLEKHDGAYVTRARFRWSDMGSWLSWGEQVDPDAAGNHARGSVLLRDASGCILYAEEGTVALLGVEDLIVVRLPDVTLVCAKDRAQEIRALLRDAEGRSDLQGIL